MSRVLAQFWRLMQLCLAGPAGKIGLLLFALVVTLDLGSVYATIRIIEWTGAFYGALEEMNAAEAVRQVGIFGIIVALNSIRQMVGQFFRKRLEMRWRGTLTHGALDIWLANKAYWTMANGASAPVGPNGMLVDNPDQRIAEDCRIFVASLMGEALDMIGRIVGLFSYLALLWSLASFPLSLSFIGLDWSVPNYMIWAAFIYVALSSLITHLLGYPLKNLMVEQQRREANFRFALSRLRLNYDEVALSGGEMVERTMFDNRFGSIVGNWRRLVNREIILGCFTYPFNHSVLRIPLFVALPGYLAGNVAFGGLMQLSTAFSSVVTSLSWFIFSYRDLAELVAASSRLDNFLEAAKQAGRNANGISQSSAGDGSLMLQGLTLANPQGATMLSVPNLRIFPGETVWLRGASGLGKTTLMKALAGLWPYGSGAVMTPDASMLFLPQRPYFPIGDIYSAIAYPQPAADFATTELDNALAKVGLSQLSGVEFGRNDTMTGHGLSGGELQRLALARLLLIKPDWALLDEPASALDVTAETEIFSRLRQELPNTSFVVVAHRPPQGLGPVRTIDLDPRIAPKPTQHPELQPA